MEGNLDQTLGIDNTQRFEDKGIIPRSVKLIFDIIKKY